MVTNNITVFISIFRPRRSYNHGTYSMINYSYQIPKFTMNMHDIVSLYTHLFIRCIFIIDIH